MTIETKYNIGDEVWWLTNDCKSPIKCSNVARINITIYESQTSVFYVLENWHPYDGYTFLSEKCLFPTKEELLKSL